MNIYEIVGEFLDDLKHDTSDLSGYAVERQLLCHNEVCRLQISFKAEDFLEGFRIVAEICSGYINHSYIIDHCDYAYRTVTVDCMTAKAKDKLFGGVT